MIFYWTLIKSFVWDMTQIPLQFKPEGKCPFHLGNKCTLRWKFDKIPVSSEWILRVNPYLQSGVKLSLLWIGQENAARCDCSFPPSRTVSGGSHTKSVSCTSGPEASFLVVLVNHKSSTSSCAWALFLGSSTSIFRRHFPSVLISSLLNGRMPVVLK